MKFLFRNLMTSRTSKFIFDQPLKQWLTRTKRREDRNRKIDDLLDVKRYLDEMENNFPSF